MTTEYYIAMQGNYFYSVETDGVTTSTPSNDVGFASAVFTASTAVEVSNAVDKVKQSIMQYQSKTNVSGFIITNLTIVPVRSW